MKSALRSRQLLADYRHNTAEATLQPIVFTLAQPAWVRHLRITVTGNSKPDEGASVWQVEAFAHPVALGDLEQRLQGFRDPTALGSDDAVAWKVEAMREAINQAAREAGQ